MAEYSFAGQRGEAARKIGLNIQKTTGTQQDYDKSQQVIQEAKENFRQTFGKELSTNSEVRTREYQQQLYDRAQKGEPGIYIPADPSKNPNADYFHLYSMDISPSKLGAEERKWLRDNGWQLVYGARDPVHWQYVGPVSDKNSPPASSIEDKNSADGQILTDRGTQLTSRQTDNLSKKSNSSDSVDMSAREAEGFTPDENPENYGYGIPDQSSSESSSQGSNGSTPNILDDYPNYTYGISLHYMTIEKYNSVVVKGAEYSSSDGTVLIASGGRRTSELARNNIFDRDMYFDNFKMHCVIGHNAKSRGGNAIDITFTVIEPMGMSLIDKILQVADQAGIQQWDQMPFIIQIDFFANDESGGLVNPIPNTTKRFCVKIIDMQIQVNARGAEYRITAIPQSHVAYLQTVGTTPANLEVKAKKVKDFFASDADPGEAGNILGGRESQQTPGGQQSFKTYSYTAALNSYQKQLKKLKHQDHADEYKFTFDDEIGNADIYIPEKQPANRSPNQNDKHKNSNYEREKGLIPVNAGTYIREVINMIVRSSKFYRDQIIDSTADDESTGGAIGAGKGDSGIGSEPIKAHKITTKVEYSNDWDSKRKVYKKTITYHVGVYKYYNTKYPEAKRGLPSSMDKEYNYIYTGKNQQILDFQIDFNTMFFTALTAMEKKYQQQQIQVQKEDQDKPDDISESNEQQVQSNRIVHNISHTQDAVQLSTMDKKYVEASDLVRSIMQNSRGDMINVRLTIAGDPELIKQDDVFSSLNNSIPTDKQQLFCRINFKMPEDIDQNTGLYLVDNRNIFSGIYQILTVDNSFERGQFIQVLDCIRLFDQPDDKKAGTGRSGSSQREVFRATTVGDLPLQQALKTSNKDASRTFRLPTISKEEYDNNNRNNPLTSVSPNDLSEAGRAVFERNLRDSNARPAEISDFGT